MPVRSRVLLIMRLMCAAVYAVFGSVVPARAQDGAGHRTTVTLLAVGDICLAGGVERAAGRSPRTYPFTAMRQTLRSADIAFGNLECALSTRGRRVPKKYNFRGSPWWAKRLAEAGFDVVSLANNHSMDYGRTALRDTVNCLREAGVQPIGGGLDLVDAHALRVLERRGLKVGFLAYLGMFPPLLPVSSSEPSVAMGYPAQVRREVSAAQKRVDVLVVSLHAGVEMAPRPSARQREIAHAAVDAGADLVVGHHPHVVQPVEIYRGKPICYSLGNFVFSPSPAVLRRPDGPWSAMAVATLRADGSVSVKLVPLRIVGRQPRPLHRDSRSQPVIVR